MDTTARALSTSCLMIAVLALAGIALPSTAAESSTEIKSVDVAVDETLDLCGEPFVTVTTFAAGNLKKDIPFWNDSTSSEGIPIYPGAGNPHAMLIGDETGTLSLEIASTGAVTPPIELQTVTQEGPCPFAYRDCGSGRCVAHIFQRCCTGGTGWGACGLLAPYAFCGVRNGESTCCNLFGECLHDLVAASASTAQLAESLIDEIKAGKVLTDIQQCSEE